MIKAMLFLDEQLPIQTEHIREKKIGRGVWRKKYDRGGGGSKKYDWGVIFQR